MTHDEHDGGTRFPVTAMIGAIILIYGALLFAGGPQWGTQQIVAAQAQHGDAAQVRQKRRRRIGW